MLSGCGVSFWDPLRIVEVPFHCADKSVGEATKPVRKGPVCKLLLVVRET
jgi:hypothetical protein